MITAIIIITTIVVRKRRKQGKQAPVESELAPTEELAPTQKSTSYMNIGNQPLLNSMRNTETSEISVPVKFSWEIDFSELTIKQEIASGNFGVVPILSNTLMTI